jgi:hypothetical protein
LKKRHLIQEVNYDIIRRTISTGNLRSNEFVELLHWLCTDEVSNNKEFIQSILSIIRFRDNDDSPINTLKNLKYYNEIILSPLLPLPSNVLPARMTARISKDDLNKHLSLIPLTMDNLLNFYFHDDQKYLLTDPNKVVYLFNLISRHMTDIQPIMSSQMKMKLSKIECIPTDKGMTLPKESYIRSRILSSDVAVITLNVVKDMLAHHDQSDDQVSIGLLKFIGCRTIHVQSFIDNQASGSKGSQSIKENFLVFLHYLIDSHKDMSEEDIEALKKSRCFAGE